MKKKVLFASSVIMWLKPFLTYIIKGEIPIYLYISFNNSFNFVIVQEIIIFWMKVKND